MNNDDRYMIQMLEENIKEAKNDIKETRQDVKKLLTESVTKEDIKGIMTELHQKADKSFVYWIVGIGITVALALFGFLTGLIQFLWGYLI